MPKVRCRACGNSRSNSRSHSAAASSSAGVVGEQQEVAPPERRVVGRADDEVGAAVGDLAARALEHREVGAVGERGNLHGGTVQSRGSVAPMSFEVRPEQPADHDAVRRVVTAAFGADDPGHGADVARIWDEPRPPPPGRSRRRGARRRGRPRRAQPGLGRRPPRPGRGVGAEPAVRRTRAAGRGLRHRAGGGRGRDRAGERRRRRCSSRAVPFYYGDRAASSGPTGTGSSRRRSSGPPGRPSRCVVFEAHEPWMTGQLIYPSVWWEHGAAGLRDPGLAELEERFASARD